MAINSPHQAKYVAHELLRSYANDNVGRLAGLLFDAQVEPKPHQIDAVLFALQTPFLKGVILADEVGLGKTIEAGLIISQFWEEKKRKILIISPSSLRQQWQQELSEKFHLSSTVIDSNSLKDYEKQHGSNLLTKEGIYICSYEFANSNVDKLKTGWDLLIADEAHKLRNYWTGRAKVAESIANIVQKSTNKTIFLTATPLQNKLEELYGLVSIFDPKYFYSLEAFKERYIKNRDLDDYDDLAQRVRQISKRTLRKTAQKYIHYTERLPLTVKFKPSPQEQQLYEMVNEYLQRDELFAFSQSQRHLSSLIIRKRLGSSTYAVASTLENIATRLEDELNTGKRRNNSGKLFFDDDIHDEELEEIEQQADSFESVNQSMAAAIKEEIIELRQFASLARSIIVNEKAVKLNDALEQGFHKLKEIGAPEKAIIFTDSTKTQEYIARSLSENGYADDVVLFNGANDSPQSNQIYREWLAKNKDSDLITNIPSVDKRKALVDYFRDTGKIMIATEAAAEGINLQFCSMVVNYDLPWNPQRVEQRIGRCHRFGQKYNVVVVNFSNQGNVAEQRILELLDTKFHLFRGVFGASDEVLGTIENGLDFERQIAQILDQCRTAEKIDAEFAKFAALHAEEITKELKNTRAKVFDNLDPNVQDRLKTYDKQSGEVLNRFEQLLLELTKYQLVEYADFIDDGRIFKLTGMPVAGINLGTYYFKSRQLENAYQYRFSGPLAQFVLESAKTADTPTAHLTFSIDQSNRVSTIAKDLRGKSGSMLVNKATFEMKAKHDDVSESYITASALTTDGELLDAEHVSKILELTCIEEGGVRQAIDTSVLQKACDLQLKELEIEVQIRNAKYYDQQEEIVYRNKQDRRAEHEAIMRELKVKEQEARKAARAETDPLVQLQLKREALKFERKQEEADDEYRAERKKQSEEADHYLELIEQALKGTKTNEELFTISWSVV